MPYTIARPRPVPLPVSLVVKNGSKTFDRVASSMPIPMSVTASITYAPLRMSGWQCTWVSSSSTLAVSIVSLPPCGIASRAFTARLSTICVICVGSASTRPNPADALTTSAMSSPIRRRSIGSIPAIVVLRSRILGASTCFLLNASSCRVRSPAWLAASLMTRTRRSRVSSPSRSVSSSSPWPVITVSRLLKSCATPPASRPMLSIFCDWRTCSSSCRRSVTSRMIPVRNAPCRVSHAANEISTGISRPSFVTPRPAPSAAPPGSTRASGIPSASSAV